MKKKNEKWVCWPNMALHLKGFKIPNLVLDAHLEQITFLEKREEKREKKARVCKRSSFGVILSHFLLLKDQTTYKRMI